MNTPANEEIRRQSPTVEETARDWLRANEDDHAEMLAYGLEWCDTFEDGLRWLRANEGRLVGAFVRASKLVFEDDDEYDGDDVPGWLDDEGDACVRSNALDDVLARMGIYKARHFAALKGAIRDWLRANEGRLVAGIPGEGGLDWFRAHEDGFVRVFSDEDEHDWLRGAGDKLPWLDAGVFDWLDANVSRVIVEDTLDWLDREGARRVAEIARLAREPIDPFRMYRAFLPDGFDAVFLGANIFLGDAIDFEALLGPGTPRREGGSS